LERLPAVLTILMSAAGLGCASASGSRRGPGGRALKNSHSLWTRNGEQFSRNLAPAAGGADDWGREKAYRVMET